jgi:hypothetical protein
MDNIIAGENTTNMILSINQINWNPNYILSKASIGQIIVSFKNILKVREKNNYEHKLYSRLKPAVQYLIDKYSDILICNSLKEYQVKYYNLIVNMPNHVSIYPDEHNMIYMRNAKIGQLIKAAKQRIRFIIYRDTPEIYLNDEETKNEWENLKIQMDNFYNEIFHFENEFLISIDEAHKSLMH